MARDSHPIVYWSQYVAARTAIMSVMLGPADGTLRVAGVLGRMFYRLDRRHRQRALVNIARSFPDWPPQRVDAVTQACFAHFLQLAAEICYTPRLIQPDSWADRIRLTGVGRALAILNAGQPALLVTGHVGNWEMVGTMLATLGYNVHALARPLDNPMLNRWLLGVRELRGLHIITKWDARDQMLEVLNQGGLLAFVADQNAGDRGLFVPFFGKLASTYKSIGLLAMRKTLPIICGYARRMPAASQSGGSAGSLAGQLPPYELVVNDIIQPQDWQHLQEPLYYITARFMRAIEDMIRQSPEQYLWLHRRWKSRPRWEKEGKPMPAYMENNLRSLPWMTDELLASVRQPLTREQMG